MMGRHDGRTAQPPAPWYLVLVHAVGRWLARLALGAVTGAVVLGATVWAGTSWESARWLAVGAALLVVVATALAARLPAVPPTDPSAASASASTAGSPRTRGDSDGAG